VINITVSDHIHCDPEPGFEHGGIIMKPWCTRVNGHLAGFLGLLFLSHPASAQFVSHEQIIRALTTPPDLSSFADKLRLTRSLTLTNPDFVLASAPSKPTVDLYEVYFEFNSAAITAEAAPQLRELGVALSDPRLKGSIISIGGHTDAVGGDEFNQNLSERRAATIKRYLVDNFALAPADLQAVGYGKRRPKNRRDVFAPENRRVEIVNETLQAQSQR
jgi:outer membrane protein OmpA-like peptidoglycan-associated protein